MTPAQLKTQIADLLAAPVTDVDKLIQALNDIIDFSTTLNAAWDAWDAAVTYNTTTNKYAEFGDRLWESKTVGNINHQPPTNPLVTEDTYWKEVSKGFGSAIQQWQASLFGDGLIVVYYDISGSGADPALYLLNEPTRPFNSTDFSSELAAGKWKRLSSTAGDILSAVIDLSSADILALNTSPKQLVAAPGANKFIQVLGIEVYKKHVTTAYAGAGASSVYAAYSSNYPINSSGIDITAAADRLHRLHLDDQFSYAPSVRINTPIVLTCSTSNPTTGDGTIKVFVTYRINSIV